MWFLLKYCNAVVSNYKICAGCQINHVHALSSNSIEWHWIVRMCICLHASFMPTAELNFNFISSFPIVPPYPNPCDSTNNTTTDVVSECSSVGSQCNVKNTLKNETSRCTCITGFHGDGFVCTRKLHHIEYRLLPQTFLCLTISLHLR